MSSNDTDRRIHTRVRLEIWVEESHDDTIYFLHSENLSTGGMFLAGTLPHPPGTVVSLKFTLPGEDLPITTRGEVIANPSDHQVGMRVRFIDLDDNPGLRTRLADFCSRRASIDSELVD